MAMLVSSTQGKIMAMPIPLPFWHKDPSTYTFHCFSSFIWIISAKKLVKALFFDGGTGLKLEDTLTKLSDPIDKHSRGVWMWDNLFQGAVG